MLDRALTFTTPTITTLIRRRGGEPHNTFGAKAVFMEDGMRRELDERVNEALAEYGLLGPRGMERGFAATIEAIAQPQVEFYGWFEGKFAPGLPSNFTVLVGSANGTGFVAARSITEEVVTIAPLRSEQLLQGFLEQIPPGQPGRGQTMIVEKSEFLTGRAPQAEAEDGFRIMQAAPRTGAPPAGGKEMQRILGLDRTGGGSVYMAARTRAGTRRRIERPLNFIDTVEGRWLMEELPGRGDSRIAFAPATLQLFGDRLRSAQSRIMGG
ncbi:ESX secretion-associated protein EspG [Amycolatopsis sp. CA-230715]|uniref:ESX secretion-associated protein EspG n=1 Tax=Amycolatopsis sp. CA-230715 TaxID=2745196 RepID=UPI001C0247A8|nr:ESX secretion-associated protein EspG [Amycolatopsis sp. CA-230715]QWF80534.1 hypothetical protein HUW46_03957 [Amycolatopsis sp. CA-230715]